MFKNLDDEQHILFENSKATLFQVASHNLPNQKGVEKSLCFYVRMYVHVPEQT